jgi:Gas vesicle synthesis protein GvpO
LADEESEAPRRRRRAREKPEAEKPEAETPPAETPEDAGKEQDGAGEEEHTVSAAIAARKAARHVVDFTGRSPECVVSIDRADGGWQVGVEVVEIRRIPDTQDVLAIYEVRVDHGGDLLSYRRTRRYARGELDGSC